MAKKKGSIFEKPKGNNEVDSSEESEDEPSTEDFEVKVHIGDKEADVYTKAGREDLKEDEDEIANWEEGFAEGAEGSESAHCENCDKPIGDRQESVIEKEVKGKLLLFCSEKCASAGPVKKKE